MPRDGVADISPFSQQADGTVGVTANVTIASPGAWPLLLAPGLGDAGPDYLEQSALIAGGSAAATIGFGASSSSATRLVGFDAAPGSQTGQRGVLTVTSGDSPVFANIGSDDFHAVGFIAAGSVSDGVTNPLDGPRSAAAGAAPHAGTGLIINLQFDDQALAAPQSFRDGMQAAVNILEAAFSDPITINIQVGFNEINGAPLPNPDISEGGSFDISESYSTLVNLLATHEASANDVTSVNSLPSGSSIQGISNIIIGDAQAKALGIISANNTATDGIVGMGSGFTGNVLIAGALHEITHAMGRDGGSQDFFRFTSVGTRLFSGSIPSAAAYFSIDNGVTKLANYGISSDPFDFLNDALTPNDPLDEFVGSNANTLTPLDIEQMDVLGFTVAPPPPPPPSPPPVQPTNLDSMQAGDFNHKGTNDTLFFGTDGTIRIYSTINGIAVSPLDIGRVGSNLTFSAVGNFFGSNAASDFILRGSQGELVLYQVQNNQVANANQIGTVGLDQEIVSVGNYDQNGTDDFIMRNINSGAMELYSVQNGQVTEASQIGVVGIDQDVVGQGNFFNNGTEDFLMEQKGTGLLTLYEVQKGQVIAAPVIGVIGSDKHVVGVGDFNGDGISDFLVQQDNGNFIMYEFQNGQVVNAPLIGTVGLNFQPAGVGNFFGNGTDDFLLRSGSIIELYKVQNYQVVSASTYGAIGENFQISGAYFNHLV